MIKKHERARLIELVEEISLGKGAYSRDQLKHAENAISSMVSLAQEALFILKEESQ